MGKKLEPCCDNIIMISAEYRNVLYRVPTSSGNHGKPGKSLKKFHAWKIMEFEKKLNNHGKIMEFCGII